MSALLIAFQMKNCFSIWFVSAIALRRRLRADTHACMRIHMCVCV